MRILLTLATWAAAMALGLGLVALEDAFGQVVSSPVCAEISDEGTPLPKRCEVNMIGAGVACADNAGSGQTDCTITGGGASALDDLSDVTLTSPPTGATLIKSAGDWVDGPLDLADTDAVTGLLPDANVVDDLTVESSADVGTDLCWRTGDKATDANATCLCRHSQTDILYNDEDCDGALDNDERLFGETCVQWATSTASFGPPRVTSPCYDNDNATNSAALTAAYCNVTSQVWLRSLGVVVTAALSSSEDCNVMLRYHNGIVATNFADTEILLGPGNTETCDDGSPTTYDAVGEFCQQTASTLASVPAGRWWAAYWQTAGTCTQMLSVNITACFVP